MQHLMKHSEYGSGTDFFSDNYLSDDNIKILSSMAQNNASVTVSGYRTYLVTLTRRHVTGAAPTLSASNGNVTLLAHYTYNTSNSAFNQCVFLVVPIDSTSSVSLTGGTFYIGSVVGIGKK